MSVMALSSRILNGMLSISRHKFALGAFFIPLLIRSIPEFLAGPYPVGWDVIAYYVPNVFDIASGSLNLWGIIASTPVMYGIVVPIYSVTRISPILIFKILGPLLYGFLGWSLFTFCKRRLQWPDSKSFYATLFVSAYFVVMRISWDAYRMELGLAFLLLAEALVGGVTSRRLDLRRAGLLSLAVLSNQLVAVIVVGIVGIEILRSLGRLNFRFVSQRIPPVAFFLLIVYATLQTPLATGLGVVGSGINAAVFPEVSVFLLYAYACVIPLLLLGLKARQRSVFTSWVGICGVGIVLSILPGHVFQDIGYRWVLLLSIPFLILAFEGYSRLRAMISRLPVIWAKSLQVTVIVGLAISAGLFAVLPAQTASPFYTAFGQFIPSSMVQSSLPSSDYQNVANAIAWINTHTPSDSALITHEAFYGWARAYISPGVTVLNCYLLSPNSALGQAEIYTHVFTVWWVQGSGWFQASTPSGARPIATFGDLVVYQYR